MDDNHPDTQLAKIAAAIAEPARAKMLCALMDGRARTSTELSVIAEVSPSTASVHCAKLREQNLVTAVAQGKHRYYQLSSKEVATALEALMAIAGIAATPFVPSTPDRLRHARTCYDHMAGEVAVVLHDHFLRLAWLLVEDESGTYQLSDAGKLGLGDLGIVIAPVGKSRRRFACSCLDWSERRPHLGGTLGAALLQHFIRHAWVERDLDSRALTVSSKGRRQFQKILARSA
ncbi:MAG: helix-turn-helix domain-containing protein [Undibacterium sp.]|nr:helix-turn-helix domain-containing protein [Undibacterium sp.]